jgi:hypothetical protein
MLYGFLHERVLVHVNSIGFCTYMIAVHAFARICQVGTGICTYSCLRAAFDGLCAKPLFEHIHLHILNRMVQIWICALVAQLANSHLDRMIQI